MVSTLPLRGLWRTVESANGVLASFLSRPTSPGVYNCSGLPWLDICVTMSSHKYGAQVWVLDFKILKFRESPKDQKSHLS